MKKQVLSILTVLGIVFPAMGQTPQQVQDPIGRTETNVHKVYNYSTQRQSGNTLPDAPSTSTGCNCSLTLDSSFSIVPFTGQVDPSDSGPCSGCPGLPPQYRNDDSYSDTINLPFSFCFYGQTFNQVYINNNGNISFGSPYCDYTSIPFPDPSYAMIAPFWADVDTRDPGSGLVYYKITPTAMIVKWDSVGYFDMNSDLVNTFQVIITDGTDPLVPNGNNVSFCYGEMQWTSGDASDGSDGLYGDPATVGINAGDGFNYMQIGTFDHPGTDYNGPYVTTSGVEWLDNQVFTFNACSGGSNIPPLANGVGICDTFTLCINDTLIIPVDFLSPEDSQTTTVTVLTTPGLLGWTLSSNSAGNPAVVTAQLIGNAANPGLDTITFIATDNGIPPATTTIRLYIFIDTSCTYSPPPIADFFTLQNQICANTCIDFTNQSVYAISYQWLFPGATPSSSTDKNPQNICYSTSGTYDVTLTASNPEGTNSITLTNYINVTAAPPTPAITQTGATLYCSTDPSYRSYQWFNDSTLIPGATDTSLLITQAGNYDVEVTTGNGCSSVASITVALPPVADFQSSDTIICANDCVNYTDLSANATSWQWLFAGAIDSTSTTQNPRNVCYSKAGVYNVTLIASNAAGSDTATFSNYIMVNASPPTPVITQSDDTLFCNTNPSYNTYQWYLDSTIITSATDTFIVISKGGNYNVQVTNGSGCKTSAGINIIYGIQNYAEDNMIYIYPNPVENIFWISDFKFRISQIQIYDVLGKMLMQSEITNPKSEILIDVSAFPSGIYFVQLKTEKDIWVGRFVKE